MSGIWDYIYENINKMKIVVPRRCSWFEMMQDSSR